MSGRNCEDCQSRFVCDKYEIGYKYLGFEEPNADMCPYYIDNNEEEE